MKKLICIGLALALLVSVPATALAADSSPAVAVIVTRDMWRDTGLYPYVSALKAEYEGEGLKVLLTDDGSSGLESIYGESAVTALTDAMGYLPSDEVAAEYGEEILLPIASEKVTIHIYDGAGERIVSTPCLFDGDAASDEGVAALVEELKASPVVWSDVPADADYLDALAFVAGAGLMNGTGGGRFEPDAPMTRATYATVLYRRAGCPETAAVAGFSDADEDWYTDAIAWAQSAGAINGYGDGSFGCDDPVTRQDAAVILWRLAGEPNDLTIDFTFGDEDEISSYAAIAVAWAYANGILTAEVGEIQPQRAATRAELAVLLMRADGLLGE